MSLKFKDSHAGIWYVSDLSSRVVAKSGNPSDRYHYGKLILQGLQDAPDFVLQIDGATGESETCRSVLRRSIKCATAFKKLGLKEGDVISVLAPNHLDVSITMYAALFLGIIFAGGDINFGEDELRLSYKVIRPKVVFCQSNKVECIKSALKGLDFTCEILTFDQDYNGNGFQDFLQKYGEDVCVQDFKAADLDPENAIALLCSTSGSTGLPKASAGTHKNLAISIPYMWLPYTKFPTPTRRILLLSPIQWFSAAFVYTHSALLKITRIQTSQLLTEEHMFHLINTYKPTYCGSSVSMLAMLLKEGVKGKCDFTCFENIACGGSVFHDKLYHEVKKASPNTYLQNLYGLTEIHGIGLVFDPRRPDTVGKVSPHLEYRLVDVTTLKDVEGPNIPGELWFKGPSVFKGYYNNPEATAETIVEDGWLRSGDILTYDEEGYFHFVERYKLLLKYKNYHVIPNEIENLLMKHPAVFQVAVTGVPHDFAGDLPIAFISTYANKNVTEEEIKEMVQANLADSKQLRGGVVFLDKLPMTSTSKIDRPKLKAMAKEMKHLFDNLEV